MANKISTNNNNSKLSGLNVDTERQRQSVSERLMEETKNEWKSSLSGPGTHTVTTEEEYYRFTGLEGNRASVGDVQNNLKV